MAQHVRRHVDPFLLGEMYVGLGRDTADNGRRFPAREAGIRLSRDSWVSVMYAEALNSTTSSVTLQSTDRQEILGQKPSDFQLSL
jgi:hypothetical protein